MRRRCDACLGHFSEHLCLMLCPYIKPERRDDELEELEEELTDQLETVQEQEDELLELLDRVGELKYELTRKGWAAIQEERRNGKS